MCHARRISQALATRSYRYIHLLQHASATTPQVLLSPLKTVTLRFHFATMSLKNIYAPAPLTTRGQPTHISLHPDGSKLAYACGRTVVIRSVSNPLAADVYSEHAKNVTAVKISPRCRVCA